MDQFYTSQRRWVFLAGALAALAGVLARPLFFPERSSDDDEVIIIPTCFGVGGVTPTGIEAIPFDYREIKAFNSCRIAVAMGMDNDKYGCIDSHGNTVVPFEWDNILEFNDARQAWALCGDESFLIDSKGKVIDHLPVRLVTEFDEFGIARATQHNRIGLVTRNGTFLSDPRISWIGEFDSQGLAPACFDDANGGLYGFIDRTGSMKIPANWTFIVGSMFGRNHFDKAGWAKVRDADWKSHWIDGTGKIVLSSQWDVSFNFDEFEDGGPSLAIVSSKDKWGYIDRTGNVAIPMHFVAAHPFDTSGLALVAIDTDGTTSWGWINRNGQFVIPPVWDEAGGFDVNGQAVVSIGGKKGCIDRIGKFTVEPRWKSLDTGRWEKVWPENLIVANDGESSKLLNKDGKVVQTIGDGNVCCVRFVKTKFHGWLIQDYYRRSLAADALIPSHWLPNRINRSYDTALDILGAGEELRLLDMNGNVIWTSNDKTRRGMAALVLLMASLICVLLWDQAKQRLAIRLRMSGMNPASAV